jgi:hypothetical protein
MNLFGATKLAVLNCLSGETKTVEQWPFIIGDGDACDVLIEGSESQCEISPSGREHVFTVHAGNGSVLLNGATTATSALKKDKNYSLKVGDELFVFRLTKDPNKWLESLAPGRWMLQHKPTTSTTGPFVSSGLSRHFPDVQFDGESETVAFLQGANIGFFVESIRYIFDELSTERLDQPKAEAPAVSVPAEEDESLGNDEGDLICPSCWRNFDAGRVMRIAKHASLRGDPILGEAEMLRFEPIRFNDNGVALDGMGVPAPDLACPHCRRRLPHGFMDFKHHIMSIVGAQTSGKSYFLCSMTRAMGDTMFKKFDATFTDADVRMNVMLTDMRDALFSARTPEEAVVAKTRLDGEMYEQLPRYGKMVPLPKPFIFNIEPRKSGEDARAVIFYDNAGENFLPGADLDRSPGIFHLASASGILFMFDPAYSTPFRERLRHSQDPQFESRHTDYQASILSGLRTLVQQTKGLDVRGRLSTPFAFMVGKFDLWRELLAADSLAQPVVDEGFDMAAVDENSQVTRELMVDICPNLVAVAESISGNVKYFPVSPTGCSPKRITNEKGEDSLAPNPAEISPFLVEVPVLWILSQIEPHLVTLRK